MLMRLIDFLKSRQITALFTSLTAGGDDLEQTEVGISSLMDTWLLLRVSRATASATAGSTCSSRAAWPTRTRCASSCSPTRASSSSDVYVGPAGVLTGSARVPRKPGSGPRALARQQEIERQQRELERRRRRWRRRSRRCAPSSRPTSEEPSAIAHAGGEQRAAALVRDRDEMARLRQGGRAAAAAARDQVRTEETEVSTARKAGTESAAGAEEFWELRLYVAGQTPKSLAAFANLKRLCEEHLAGRYRIEVVDLMENPNWRRGIRSWRSRPWCASCPRRSARSSATCRTPNGCWSGSICVPAAVGEARPPHERTKDDYEWRQAR